jgi:hypothetical protein
MLSAAEMTPRVFRAAFRVYVAVLVDRHPACWNYILASSKIS